MTAPRNPETHPRDLVLVLGDQLDHDSAAFDGFDPERDALWMAETHEEATHVWCHKMRLAFFFSAMRHFRDEQRESGRHVHYHALRRRPSDDRGTYFAEVLTRDVHRLHPERIVLVAPGDERVAEMLRGACDELGVESEVRDDRHFYETPEAFAEFAGERKNLVLEHYYRKLRRAHDVLMTGDGKPAGGEWNYDEDNREAFGKDGPGEIKRPRQFGTDALTDEVIELVNHRFADHPGTLEHFDLPVTRQQALAYLRDFIQHRLPGFGRYEDAMWQHEPFLYHSRLSAVLNVKLLSPRECVDKAVTAYEEGDAPINSVEGFVRQILGWREFIRGVYTLHMPAYGERNALRCRDRDVPGFFWDGKTDMACVADCMDSVLKYAWAHHIPRLMVLGQFALLLGVHPYRFHEWHMAMYADAIDWVSLPNALGMSQHGDGGIVGTKPYCASGNYINRMSNYCADCRYRHDEATGESACPFTTLYWDFLDRHQKQFSDNRRMNFQMRNLERKSADDRKAIRARARTLRKAIDDGRRV